jgi:uncharacterized membrane protein YkoI
MNRRSKNTVKRARFAAIATALAALLVVGNTAAARPRAAALAQTEGDQSLTPAQGDQFVPAQRGGGVSLAQATSMAQSRYQGRVVRAETTQVGDRVVHEIRILGDDGRVRTVRIDAQTGSFL